MTRRFGAPIVSHSSAASAGVIIDLERVTTGKVGKTQSDMLRRWSPLVGLEVPLSAGVVGGSAVSGGGGAGSAVGSMVSDMRYANGLFPGEVVFEKVERIEERKSSSAQ